MNIFDYSPPKYTFSIVRGVINGYVSLSLLFFVSLFPPRKPLRNFSLFKSVK